MSHFALLWKARTIEKHRQNYENEKHNSIIMSNADIPDKTLLQQMRHYSHDVQKRLSRSFSKWYPEGTTVSKFFVNFRAEMRFPHILLRSLFGFVGGLVLTYVCFVFLMFQLFLPLIHATVLSSLFGILITLGLTFSNRMRCLIFLLIPQLFSRAGRYTLTCYALVLILTGPATNTLKNSEVLSESMACSQEKLKISNRDINQALAKPFNSIKESIKMMVEQFKRITLKMRIAMLRVNRLILSIASLIQSNFSWLESIAKSCNNKLGSPYQRCSSSLKDNIDCKTCSEDAPWYYSAATVTRVACGVLKPYEKFCVPSDFAGETFYATVQRKLKIFIDRLSEAMYLKIRTQHSYTFVGNTSSPSQVAAGIVTEIRNRADPIFTWLSWSSCVTSLFLLLIFFRANYYQNMYETRSRFDNRYITKEFRQLDLKRLREGRETVLPLNRRERAKYVTTTSFRLVASEKTYLNRSAVFMTITSFKLLIHIVADYSLYWVLATIRHHGKLQSPFQQELPNTGANITGSGFVSRLLQSLFDTMNIPLRTAPSTSSCLPKPHPPDFKRYSQIGTLIFLLWIFSLFEPYGLRLRHLIMGHYKPERAIARAAWLYNHILKTRGSFMKFARRKLHREYKYRSDKNLTFRHWLRSFVPFHWLRCFLGIRTILDMSQESCCLLCNTFQDDEDINTKLTRCQNSKCPGIFCVKCFTDIGQMCTICLSPEDYGDLSDVSLEKGSSEDDDDEPDKSASKRTTNDKIDLDEYSYECNESECSGNSRDINNEMSPFIRHYNAIANGKNHSVTGYDKQTTLASKYQVPNKERETHIFYSFYRITIQDMSLVVTKKGQSSRAHILRRKDSNIKSYGTKNKIIFMNSNNKTKYTTQKVKTGDGKKKEVKNNKETNNKYNCENDNVLNNTQKDDAKKQKKRQKRDHKVEQTYKKSCENSFEAKCSKYWKNISNALSCTDIGDSKNDLLDKKKHKRKKKTIKEQTNKLSKRNNEDARRYRISTFLAGQDWKKKEVDNKITGGSLIETAKNFEENEINVNNIRIPRLNLQISSESLDNIIKENKEPTCKVDHSEKGQYPKRKHLKFGPLDRYIERISVSSMALISPPELPKALKIDDDLDNTKFIMPRSMKYFQSLDKGYEQRTNDAFPRRVCTPAKGASQTSKNDLNKSDASKEMYNNETVASLEQCKPEGAVLEANTCNEPVITKKSLQSLNKVSNIKRRSSEKMLAFGFKSPLVVIKDLCTALFTFSEDKNQKNHETTADKKIGAYPSMESCGCQNSLKNVKVEQKHCCVQVEQMMEPVKVKSRRFFKAFRDNCDKAKVADVQVNAVPPTCTCATQYYTSRRDVGTLKTQTTDRVDVSSDTESFEDSVLSSDSVPDSETMSTKQTNTNTTVCSLATVDRRKEERGKNRKGRIKVVTKSNRSTVTDRATVHDASTTYDWWSPIVEKRVYKKEILGQKQDLTVLEKRRVRNRGMVTDGRIVTFMSRTQIIPTDSYFTTKDILSPSRYLLESQKYYNELYTSKLYSPHVYPVTRVYKHHKFEQLSSISSQRSRPGRRIKRLEECGIRKQTPRKKRMDNSNPADSTRQFQKRINRKS